MIARPSRVEAVDAAYGMIDGLGAESRRTHREFSSKSDSTAFKSTYALADNNESGWLTSYLWSGAVPYLGAPAIALVGSAEDVAGAIMEYQQIGITQFLFMGWPDLEEMTFFSKAVVPLVRAKESSAIEAPCRASS
jgi:alkanesulfonate monooxygenase